MLSLWEHNSLTKLSDAYIYRQLITWLTGPLRPTKILLAFIFPGHHISPAFLQNLHSLQERDVSQAVSFEYSDMSEHCSAGTTLGHHGFFA